MELTLHTPAREWYVETPSNNLSYWGLDYPPLSAYQSWLCGAAVAALEPEAVALRASHGYETRSSKALLRASVLAFDAALFFPAVWAALRALHPRRTRADLACALALVLMQPGEPSRAAHRARCTPCAPLTRAAATWQRLC
jgi:alpha-1,3-glucosyltransferase